MNAVYFDVTRFLTEEHLHEHLQKREDFDRQYGRDDYTRTVTNDGLGVISTEYRPCDWWNFDDLFERQMKSRHALFAQPGSLKRTSRNGYDPPLIDHDPEEDYC